MFFKASLKIQPEVINSINTISLTCSSDFFVLDKSSFTIADAILVEGVYSIDTYARGSINVLNEPVNVNAVINYSENKIFSFSA